MAHITISHASINGGTPVRVFSNSVTVSSKLNNAAKPTGNGNSLTEVLNQAWENPLIKIPRIRILPVANSLQVTDVYALLKIKYGGSTAAPVLNVVYGKLADTKALVGAGNASDIKVVLDTFNLMVDITDSKEGYAPVVDLNFVETA